MDLSKVENFMNLFDIGNDTKRKMGRPPKISPFSHYDEYKPTDVEFFISLIAGREELYNPCDEFVEEKQNAFYFIEKKCSHFLAMRKGRNAEKLWLFLFNDFEKAYRNYTRSSSSQSSFTIEFPFYKYMEFLIPYIENAEKREKSITASATSTVGLIAKLNGAATTSIDGVHETNTFPPMKRPKFETSEQDDWFMKVLETVTKPIEPVLTMNQHREPSPPQSATIKIEKGTTVTEAKVEIDTQSKHMDILTCMTAYLDSVPNDKLMLCKVRLFQFIEGEKEKIKNGVGLSFTL